MESESEYVPDKFSVYRSGAAVCIGTIELLYVRCTQAVAILIVLLLSSNDCDRPIRVWLYVQMSLYLGHVLFVVIAELVSLCGSYQLRKFIGESYLASNSIIEGAILLWVLLGNVWFFDCARTCKDDYQEGFIMMIVVLATYYSIVVVVGLALFVLTCLVCMGSAAANRAKYVTLS